MPVPVYHHEPLRSLELFSLISLYPIDTSIQSCILGTQLNKETADGSKMKTPQVKALSGMTPLGIKPASQLDLFNTQKFLDILGTKKEIDLNTGKKLSSLAVFL